MSSRLRSAVTIALLTLGCGVLLSQTAAWTARPIEQARAAALRDALTGLVDSGQIDAAFERERWPLALCDGITLVQSEARGYGGAIIIAVALRDTAAQEGAIDRLIVLRHRETPGIGDFIEPLTQPPWLDRFRGATASSLAQRPLTADAVSGATITVRAVRKALTQTLANAAAEELPVNAAPCAATTP